MRRRLVAFVTAGVFALAFSAGAAAEHPAPPCNDSGEPGNSDYAQHHIVPLAKAGALGAGGHVPGSHKGYSTCQ